MVKYFLYWLPLLLIAIINGTLRDLWYKKELGELSAHQLSTITLIVLIGLYCWPILKANEPTGTQAVIMGLTWAILTLLFEFGLGISQGMSKEQLLNDYQILRGRIWILIPLWLTIAPSVIRWLIMIFKK